VLERYRTLGAMLALRTFSVPEVAALAGVREATVRTILRRERKYLEKVGVRQTGRRGGQLTLWRLLPDASETIRLELAKLEKVGMGPWLGERPDVGEGPPAPILAAQDVLLRLVPAAIDPAERAGLVDLARTQIETAENSNVRIDGALGAHHRTLQLLLDLEDAEQEEWRLAAPRRLPSGREISAELLLAAGQTQDEKLMNAVRKRLGITSFGMPEQPVLKLRNPTSAQKHGAGRLVYNRDNPVSKSIFVRNFIIRHSGPNYPKSASSDALDTISSFSGIDILTSGINSARLFGTDGIRGIAGAELSVPLAAQLAIAAAQVLGRRSLGAGARAMTRRPVAIVGRDPTLSSQFLESAITAGLNSCGVDVVRLGVVPTSAVAFTTAEEHAEFGLMLSASHNRAPNNAIKFFGRGGYKLTDAAEDEIERELDRAIVEPGFTEPPEAGFGHATDGSAYIAKYKTHLLSSLSALPRNPSQALEGMRVIVDCANGSASYLGPEMLRAAGAEVIAIGIEPDGVNTNVGFGSTDPQALVTAVKEYGADAGIAYDGDADRSVAVDHLGNIVDGDEILAILAIDLANQGRLAHRTVVTTVMSNLGFRLSMREAEINVVETPVGDRYVIDEMQRGDYVLGGEQAGRIIMADYATAPDGLLVSLNLLAIAARHGRTLADLKSVMTKYPQVLVNVPVPREEQPLVADSAELTDAVREAAAELGERGRIVLRPSGTEPVVRVMVEDNDSQHAQRLAEQLAEAVRELL
jgi:phosphoglucosamine mutase